VTKLEIHLIPAKEYVALSYHSFSSVYETIECVRHAMSDPGNDYVDGIIFSKSHGVVMTGRLTNSFPPSHKPQTFSGPWDPWFYLHAKSRPRDTVSTDYIPVAEYLFRYDCSGFWVGKLAFEYFGFVPFTRFTRWFLNDFVHTRMMYRALHRSNMSSTMMIHDLSLPYDTVKDFVDYMSKELGIWPRWLCPLRYYTGDEFVQLYDRKWYDALR
jgi:delta24-sterol reductase